MTDKSAAAARELVERWMGKKHPITMQSYVSDLTALISEDYVEKAKYDEAVHQRDELKEAMKRIMFSSGTLKTVQDIAEAAIKNTEG